MLIRSSKQSFPNICGRNTIEYLTVDPLTSQFTCLSAKADFLCDGNVVCYQQTTFTWEPKGGRGLAPKHGRDWVTVESEMQDAQSSHPRVLYVDGKVPALKAFADRISHLPVQVHTTQNPIEALGMIGEQEYSVIASAIRMPFFDGISFLEASREYHPGGCRVLTTSEADFEFAVKAVKRAGIHRLVPNGFADLASIVAELIDLAPGGSSHNVAESSLDEFEEDPDCYLDVITQAIDAHDIQLHRHSQRAALYARLLGRRLGLRKSELGVLERGSLLHDLGKLALTSKVHCKPGRLSTDEWAEMQRHPMLGYGMLEELSCLEDARTIVLQHHERWDGAGYPDGRGCSEIHLGARIFAVADAFDAMTSHRPYRDTLPFDSAWEEIRGCCGSQFDPVVVQTFEGLGIERWRNLVGLVSPKTTTADNA